MTGKDELSSFKKMWTWLIGYPAHDRDYYMKHVAGLDKIWSNSCPLSNSTKVEDCSGCQVLWDSREGTLCTDPGAPIYKWVNTEKYQEDDRSYYASQIAVLAMQAIRKFE